MHDISLSLTTVARSMIPCHQTNRQYEQEEASKQAARVPPLRYQSTSILIVLSGCWTSGSFLIVIVSTPLSTLQMQLDTVMESHPQHSFRDTFHDFLSSDIECGMNNHRAETAVKSAFSGRDGTVRSNLPIRRSSRCRGFRSCRCCSSEEDEEDASGC